MNPPPILPFSGAMLTGSLFSSNLEPNDGKQALESHEKQLGVMEVLLKVFEEYYIDEVRWSDLVFLKITIAALN